MLPAIYYVLSFRLYRKFFFLEMGDFFWCRHFSPSMVAPWLHTAIQPDRPAQTFTTISFNTSDSEHEESFMCLYSKRKSGVFCKRDF